MIPRWRPLPTAAGLDATLRGATHAARGVWMLLACASDAEGVVEAPESMAPEDTVDAVAGAGASAHLPELRDKRLVLVAMAGGALHLPLVAAWVEDHTPGALAQAAQPARVAAPRDPEHVAALGRLKAQFSKRALKTADARLAWLEGNDGRKVLAHLGLTLEDARPLAEAAGRRGGRFGVDRPVRAAVTPVTSDGGNHGGNGYLRDGGNPVVTGAPPPAPPSPRETERSAAQSAGARGGNHGGNHGGNPTEVTKTAVTSATVVTAGGLVEALVAAAGGGIVRPDLLMAAELEGVLVECALTPDEARAWGADLGTSQGRRITWPWVKDADALVHGSWLRGHDPARAEQPWRRVREGVATWRHHREKRRRATEKRPAPAVASVPPAPTSAPLATAADARRHHPLRQPET